MKRLIATLSLFLTAFAHAVPGTYDVPLTFDPPANGVPDSYSVYNGCDIADQALVGAVLVQGNFVSGGSVSVAGDSDVPLALCVVPIYAGATGPFDYVQPVAASGEGPVQNVNATCTFTADDAGNVTNWACVAN